MCHGAAFFFGNRLGSREGRAAMDFAILYATLHVFLIMALGFLMQHRGWLAEGLDTGFMRLAINLLIPCLIYDKLIGDDALNHIPTVASAIGLGFLIIVTSISICLLATRIVGLERGSGRRTFAIATGIQNYGFIALPVLTSLFSDDPPLAILFLFGMGVELAVWTFGMMVLSGSSGPNLKLMINGPFIAVTTGLALHYLKAESWMPVPLSNTFSLLGSCAIPMCLFMIGVTIAHQSKMSRWDLRWPTVLAACSLRHAILPAIILACAAFLPLREELKQVLLVQAAMPAAVFPIMLARMYDGHTPTAIQVVLVTTGVSFLTMPLILELGRSWIGL